MAWVRFWRRPGGGNLVKTYQPGSILSLAPTKGLLNEPGQNSCFLNSAVQVLWQLDIFRRSLRGLTGHVCFGDACIFCALKSIFAQFQHSREKALPSDIMRNALAESFKDEHRFQLGHMDDAAECFENILARIHFHIVPNSEGDMCTSKSCITHQKFAMTLYEQCVCRSCGASSDPLPFTELVRYISTTALCNEVDRMLERHERLKPELFAELLQAANTADDYRKCPSNCGQKIKIRRVLMNCPEIVTIGLVWDYEHSDLTENVLKNLATQLYLPGLFYSVTDEQAKNSELCLVGMICYASRHYCAFAYHNRSSKWVFFDDATVKEVGPKWKDVVTKCIRCHFQPLLLFYANPDGTSVSTEDALREVIQWSHYKTVPGSREETGTERVPLYSKKQDPAKQFEYRDSANMNSGHRIQSEGGAFNLGHVQASGGRGQVKVGHNDQRDRVKDISKECAQKAVLLKSTSSSQRKIVDRVQRKDVAKQKDDLNQFKSGSPPLTYEFKSANPVGNGFRPSTDHRFFYSQGRGPYKHEPPTPTTKSVQLPVSSKPQALSVERQVSKVKSEILTDSETENSINSKDKGSSKSHRAWKPMRETLNVDSIFHETEKKQPHSPRHKANSSSKPQYSKEQNFHWQRELPKQKGLTTIYEDESKLDSGSRSSLESEGKGQGEKERGKVPPDLKTHFQDNWQMQRTESGYESSDHISNGSTNLDSPVIEGTSPDDCKSVKEAFFYSDPQPTNKLQNGVAENGFYSATLYTKNQGGVLKAEKTALEVNYRPHDEWSPESDLQMRTLPLQWQEKADSNKKFFPLLTVPGPLKNSNIKEMQTNKSNFNHSEWLLQDEHIVPLHSNASFTSSFNSINTLVDNVLLNEKECLPAFQYPVKSTATKAPLQSSLQTLPSRDLLGTTDEMPLGESYAAENTGIYRGLVINNVVPALPPKKYARSTVPGRETNSESGNQGQVMEMLGRVKPSRHGKGPSGDPLVTGNEKQVFVKDTRQKTGIQEHDFHARKTNLLVTLPIDCWAVPDSPISKSSQDGLSADSISENDTVSLTTYFSVDSCMTDTYRMKYHQRPRLYFSENSDFQKEDESLQLDEKELDPTLHRTVNSRPTPGPRSKASPDVVRCNR